ncbi:Protein of unknown function, partial [Gryllus bimaculatus]
MYLEASSAFVLPVWPILTQKLCVRSYQELYYLLMDLEV